MLVVTKWRLRMGQTKEPLNPQEGHQSRNINYILSHFIRSCITRSDRTTVLALYLSQLRKYMTINDDKLWEDILKVGGELKYTAMFMKDSVCDSKFDPKKGKQKSAIAIPGGLWNQKFRTEPKIYKKDVFPRWEGMSKLPWSFKGRMHSWYWDKQRSDWNPQEGKLPWSF